MRYLFWQRLVYFFYIARRNLPYTLMILFLATCVFYRFTKKDPIPENPQINTFFSGQEILDNVITVTYQGQDIKVKIDNIILPNENFPLDNCERKMALRMKNFLYRQLSQAKNVLVLPVTGLNALNQKEAFFAALRVDGTDIRQVLLKNNLAFPKEIPTVDWCKLEDGFIVKK